jgi:hypothetical protein
VLFNDFLMDIHVMANNLNILMKNRSSAVPSNLLSIKAKKFEIFFNHKDSCVNCTPHYESTTNEMNSSMEFQYQARKKDDKIRRGKKSEKVYILRLFRNGMLQIPGVADHFPMSEAAHAVNHMIQLYETLFEAQNRVTVN